MKKMVIFPVLIILILLSGNSFAQGFHDIGLREGVTWTGVYDYEGVDTEMKTNLCIGGYLTFHISEKFKIEQELYFTSKGFKTSMDSQVEIDATNYNKINESTLVSFSYVEMPLLAVFSVTDKIKLKVGGYADFCISASNEVKTKTETYTLHEETVDETTVSSWDETAVSTDRKYQSLLIGDVNTPGFGLVFGVEYDLGTINIGARYSMGLTNVSAKDDMEYNHNAIQLLLGFPL